MEKLQREIYRYLGYRGSEPGEQVRALVDNCLEERERCQGLSFYGGVFRWPSCQRVC